MIRSIAIAALLLPVSVIHAQDDEQIFDRLFSEIFVSEENVEGLEEAYQQLYHYFLHPLNLNDVSADELRALLLLTEQQVNDIVKHREKTGKFLSVYELQTVASLALADLRLLTAFLTVDEIQGPRESNDYIQVRYERDMQLRKGYRPNPGDPGKTAYLGTPDKLLFRMRGVIGQTVSYGLMAEKDAGENIIIDPDTRRFGADYYSGYIRYQGTSALEQLVVGDYQLQFGQGLVYSSGFSLGKSAGELGGFRRISTGIRPHTSTMESGFLRGVSATFRSGPFRLTAFASINNNDASVKEDESSFSGFNKSGLHRTKNEIRQKDNLRENHGGAVIRYDGKRLDGGVGLSAIQFSSVWQPAGRLYNLKAFTGDHLNTIFNFWNYRWRNINVFVENAWLQHGGWGTVGGCLTNLSSTVQYGFIMRKYDAGFSSLYGNAIGEKTANTNERGAFWLLNWQILKPLHFSIYVDRFRFPWLSYRISQPSTGYEYLIRLRYNLSRKAYFIFQYKEEEKDRDMENMQAVYVLPDKKQSYQAVVHFPVTGELTFRTRVQGSNTSLSGGNGVAVMQDIAYTHMKFKLRVRYSLFNTDDFANRQYVYENDVLYAFNFPALQGRGARYYALIKYNAGRKWKIEGRYSRTLYADTEEISSGNELIEGNEISEVKMQVTYKL